MGYLVGDRLVECTGTTKTLRTTSRTRQDSLLDPRALFGRLFGSAKPLTQHWRRREDE